MIQSDKQIIELAAKHSIIEPFIDHQISGDNVISYGLSSYGYDIRLAQKSFKIYSGNQINTINPKTIRHPSNSLKLLKTVKLSKDRWGSYFVIPPNTTGLGVSVEKFNLPENILATAIGKSTYARCGLNVLVTPIEPGYSGYLVIELANCTTEPIRVFANEGILQLLFFKGDKCIKSYSDRKGKYQNQAQTITLPIVK